jgi:hypothetical protein
MSIKTDPFLDKRPALEECYELLEKAASEAKLAQNDHGYTAAIYVHQAKSRIYDLLQAEGK